MRRTDGDLGCKLPGAKELYRSNLKAVIVGGLGEPLLQRLRQEVGEVLARRLDRPASDLSLPAFPQAGSASACGSIADSAVSDCGPGVAWAHSFVEDGAALTDGTSMTAAADNEHAQPRERCPLQDHALKIRRRGRERSRRGRLSVPVTLSWRSRARAGDWFGSN